MLNVSAVVVRLWLFDIVKRVLTYSLWRGVGGVSARCVRRGTIRDLAGVKRVMIAECICRDTVSDKIYRPLGYLRFCLDGECRVRL
jgi:hypothetical protein